MLQNGYTAFICSDALENESMSLCQVSATPELTDKNNLFHSHLHRFLFFKQCFLSAIVAEA